jgi:hypothetical protein
MVQQVLSLAPDRQKQLSLLVEKSHSHYIDLNTVVQWDSGVKRDRMPKRSDHCWVYGTPTWDGLTEAQRLELAWKENARDVSMFVWLEETLPPLFVGYINRFGAQIPVPIHEYMMIFAKEEIIHTLMFRRYLGLANLELFQPPDGLHDLFVKQLPTMHPIAGVLCTYLVENVAEEGAMQGTDGPDVDPLTRDVYRAHHFEEARHIAFGKWVCETFLETAPADVKAQLGGLARAFMSRLVPQFTYNKEISQHLSFDLGIDPQDAIAIEKVRLSDNNRRINHERYGDMLEWMKRVGLAPADWTWFTSSAPPS